MNELFYAAIKIIMNDWDWRPNGESECKFCGHSYNWPSIEKHWEHCPRLIWAIANDDTPSKRVNKRFKGEEWDDHEAVKYYRGPYLYNDGPELLRILAETYPDVYGAHFAEYERLHAEYKMVAK